MRVLSLLTALCLATTAYANAIRGGYERLWFWHIYSLEIQQYGVGNTWIANGCRGTGGLACNFNDFIKPSRQSQQPIFQIWMGLQEH